MIRILIADDHTLVRAGLRRLIDAEKDMEVVGEAANGREAIKLCRELDPDVLVLDFDMPEIDGLSATETILARQPETRILILTMHDNEEYARRFIQAGAAGFIPKEISPEELAVAIRRIAAGRTYFTAAMAEPAPQAHSEHDQPISILSQRELQVLKQLAGGLTTNEIADSLNVSVSTVKTYRARILEKLHLRNVSDLTRFAIRNKLIDKYS